MSDFEPVPGLFLKHIFEHRLLDVYRSDELTWSVARGEWKNEDVDLYFNEGIGEQPARSRFVVDLRRVHGTSLSARYDTATRLRKIKERRYRSVVILDDQVQHFIMRTLVRISGRSDIAVTQNELDAYEALMKIN